MIRGSCLCSGVKVEIARTAGPFELCHCSRCRKTSGSAFLPWLEARREDVHLLKGRDLIKVYELPVEESPPGYKSCFCGRCGSPVPDVNGSTPWLDIPAGFLDDDPGSRPDKHIFVDVKSAWFDITDGLPQFDKTALKRYRNARQSR